jgi:hypothetical protein
MDTVDSDRRPAQFKKKLKELSKSVSESDTIVGFG